MIPKNFDEAAESGLSSHALFGLGDELEFKRQFAVQFLASWAATHYTEYCARGMQETLGTPPVEDAEYLAQKTWEQWCAILLPNVTTHTPGADEKPLK